MDNSEAYIKQCEKAEEIQKGWKPSMGDWTRITNYYVTSTGKKSKKGKKQIFVLDNQFDAQHIDHEFYNTIWLPRQDQLQEMVEIRNMFELTVIFYRYVMTLVNVPYSMEQLWLAFIMKQKYNKTWDSEKEEWEICT